MEQLAPIACNVYALAIHRKNHDRKIGLGRFDYTRCLFGLLALMLLTRVVLQDAPSRQHHLPAAAVRFVGQRSAARQRGWRATWRAEHGACVCRRAACCRRRYGIHRLQRARQRQPTQVPIHYKLSVLRVSIKPDLHPARRTKQNIYELLAGSESVRIRATTPLTKRRD